MNRPSKAFLLLALVGAGCAPTLETGCTTAADCPSRQCVAGRCLAPAEPTPEADAEVPPADALVRDALARDARVRDATPAPAPDAFVQPVPDALVPPTPDAFVPPVPDALVPPVPDAFVPPPPDPDAFVPPPDELCDGIDQDGDSAIDEGFPRLGLPCIAGAGLCAAGGVEVCTADGLDTTCDAVPGDPLPEVCNGVDDDCDGETDEGVTRPFARDGDADGYGSPEMIAHACETPLGFVEDQTDCNDRDPAVHPDVKERCNGFDDDCDGNTDADASGAPVGCGVPHGESACRAGVCSPPRCAPGWHDLDALTENGCERGCDDAGEGLPVGGRGDGLTEPPALAGPVPAILWADTAQPAEGRLRFAAGPTSALVGREDATYRAPSLVSTPAGYVAAAVRNVRDPNGNDALPAEGVVLGLDAAGATTFEIVVSALGGATAITTTPWDAAGGMAVMAIGPADPASATMELSCLELGGAHAARTVNIALPAAAAPARPVLRALNDIVILATPAGNGVLLMVVAPGCRAEGLALAPFAHFVASAGLGLNTTPDGRTVVVVSGVDGSHQSIAAFDASNPPNLVALPEATEHMVRNTGFGCPSSVVPTAGGFWVFSCDELAGAQAYGFPLDFQGRRVADAQFVVHPPAIGGSVDFMRAVAAPGGAALTWMVAPAAGVRGPLRQARLTCE